MVGGVSGVDLGCEEKVLGCGLKEGERRAYPAIEF
jgi:hypothetical protein